MGKFVYGMQLSLDSYVDHDLFEPDPVLFQHRIDHTGTITGSLYGRRLYEIMAYWDENRPEWGDAEHAFAEVWRRQHKWVVSRTLETVGPNATLISEEIEASNHALKTGSDGEIDVGGPALAQSLSDWGLIDEYRLYLFPFVIGGSNRFFHGPRPPLRLVGNEQIGRDVVRLSYVPA